MQIERHLFNLQFAFFNFQFAIPSKRNGPPGGGRAVLGEGSGRKLAWPRRRGIAAAIEKTCRPQGYGLGEVRKRRSSQKLARRPPVCTWPVRPANICCARDVVQRRCRSR